MGNPQWVVLILFMKLALTSLYILLETIGHKRRPELLVI